jgi:hypothetical protein
MDMVKINCPNKNDPGWKRLVADLGGGERGEARAYVAFFRNGDKIPNVETALSLLFRKPPTLPASEPAKKLAAARSPAPKLAPELFLGKTKLVKTILPKSAIYLRRVVAPKINAESVTKHFERTRHTSKVPTEAQ